MQMMPQPHPFYLELQLELHLRGEGSELRLRCRDNIRLYKFIRTSYVDAAREPDIFSQMGK